MNATATNQINFTNKHASRAHKCTIGHVSISMAEVLYFYKTTYAADQQDQISHTGLMTLVQHMTDAEIEAAIFTKEEMAAFLSTGGGNQAVTALRQA